MDSEYDCFIVDRAYFNFGGPMSQIPKLPSPKIGYLIMPESCRGIETLEYYDRNEIERWHAEVFKDAVEIECSRQNNGHWYASTNGCFAKTHKALSFRYFCLDLDFSLHRLL